MIILTKEDAMTRKMYWIGWILIVIQIICHSYLEWQISKGCVANVHAHNSAKGGINPNYARDVHFKQRLTIKDLEHLGGTDVSNLSLRQRIQVIHAEIIRLREINEEDYLRLLEFD